MAWDLSRSQRTRRALYMAIRAWTSTLIGIIARSGTGAGATDVAVGCLPFRRRGCTLEQTALLSQAC